MPWAASAPRVEAPGISGARTHLAIRNRKVRGGITRGARCCPAGPFLPRRAGAQHRAGAQLRARCVGFFPRAAPRRAGVMQHFAAAVPEFWQASSLSRSAPPRAAPAASPGHGDSPWGGRAGAHPSLLPPFGSNPPARGGEHRHVGIATSPRVLACLWGRDERDGGRHKPLPSPETDRGGGSAPPQAFLGRKREGGEITSERHVPRAGPGRDAHGGGGQLRAFLGAG